MTYILRKILWSYSIIWKYIQITMVLNFHEINVSKYLIQKVVTCFTWKIIPKCQDNTNVTFAISYLEARKIWNHIVLSIRKTIDILVKPEDRVSELFRPLLNIKDIILARYFINARNVRKALLNPINWRGICLYIQEIYHMSVMNVEQDFRKVDTFKIIFRIIPWKKNMKF